VKIFGRWTCLYRAIDQYRQVIDVLLSQRRDLAAARRFFRRVLTRHRPGRDHKGPSRGLCASSRRADSFGSGRAAARRVGGHQTRVGAFIRDLDRGPRHRLCAVFGELATVIWATFISVGVCSHARPSASAASALEDRISRFASRVTKPQRVC
jgi:hypothetical protein